jgi:uncharacterized protein (DUF1501 family)
MTSIKTSAMQKLATRRRLLLGAGAAACFDLEKIAAAAADAVSTRSWAQAAPVGEDYRALVCLFMYGGNDSNNMIIPLDDIQHAVYAAKRGPLLIPKNQVLGIPTANTGALKLGLHPAMSAIQKVFNSGKAAVVANVGPLAVPTSKTQWDGRSVPLPPNLFSHSDQQAQWQSSILDGPRTGWGGRLVDLLQNLNSNRTASTMSLSGNTAWGNGANLQAYKVSPNGKFGFDFFKPASGSDPISIAVNEMRSAPRNHLLEREWIATMNRSVIAQESFAKAIATQTFTTPFPGNNLGNQLKMAARLIASRQALGLKRQTLFVSIGGFDTHGDDQPQRQRQLLEEISSSVAAFYDATVQMGIADNVTLFTSSDFGRNLASNGKGSDHGWGSHHMVVGGAVKGGQLYGTFPNLAIGGPDDVGNQGIWIPTTSVDQYAASLARWFGVSATEMPTIFPGLSRFANADLGILT